MSQYPGFVESVFHRREVMISTESFTFSGPFSLGNAQSGFRKEEHFICSISC